MDLWACELQPVGLWTWLVEVKSKSHRGQIETKTQAIEMLASLWTWGLWTCHLLLVGLWTHGAVRLWTCELGLAGLWAWPVEVKSRPKSRPKRSLTQIESRPNQGANRSPKIDIKSRPQIEVLHISTWTDKDVHAPGSGIPYREQIRKRRLNLSGS